MTEALIFALICVVLFVAERARRDLARQHRERLVAILITSLSPAAARSEPRDLLAWRGAADTARRLFPEAVGAIERRTGEAFPFPHAVVDDAHARWTAEWLAWERRHDADFKQRANALDTDLRAAGDTPAGVRARLSALDDEKLQAYQERYEEYVRIGNGLAALRERASEGERAS
ncbi:MAG: hypothetical protein OXG04_00935 [Acidobacteria bacterium]|nr:hypothetical protein [Acidobacteriota bacterium]